MGAVLGTSKEESADGGSEEGEALAVGEQPHKSMDASGGDGPLQEREDRMRGEGVARVDGEVAISRWQHDRVTEQRACAHTTCSVRL